MPIALHCAPFENPKRAELEREFSLIYFIANKFIGQPPSHAQCLSRLVKPFISVYDWRPIAGEATQTQIVIHLPNNPYAVRT